MSDRFLDLEEDVLPDCPNCEAEGIGVELPTRCSECGEFFPEIKTKELDRYE